MRLLIFLKALRLRNYCISGQSFLVAFAVFFFSIANNICFTSLGYANKLPSLPSDPPAPQTLLPLDDIIPSRPSSEPAIPDSDSTAVTLEDFDSSSSPTERAQQRKEAEVSRLLKKLKFCANVDEAKTISKQLQTLWSQSGSETIDLLMFWAETATNADNYGLALDYIDNVLALLPTYAEAWVRRAWIHIQLSDFKLAMLDLNQALTLEPRNYMAFFELGVAMEATERPELALKAYKTALEYYPQMQRIQKRVEELIEKKSPQTL
ncbi:tetratricopeptide repeat protein [Bartonella raoultii]|uniref:Tetratricopeptide repeat protein n=1 Tax=Bartonella raoultii TaxID=1457020 RepID=A0ABS7I7K6_9HYPH|nr:hypothetical protein [Bartonella raoultii]MBX4336475.1 hypothetical protein [Bartonella raoultii]